MTIASVLPPYFVFPDANGEPLENGYIYIGQPGFEARTTPKPSFFDTDMAIPTGTASGAAIRTMGGFPMRNGSPSMFYVEDDYSITVLDRNGIVVYSSLNATLALDVDIPASLVPAISPTDARKTLAVNSDGTAYELRTRKQFAKLVYSQSNARRLGTTPVGYVFPPNLFVWNGGIDGATGTDFIAAKTTPTVMRTYIAEAAEYANDHPDTDVYLVICATGGVGVRSVVGMDYLWDTGLSGDPGTGAIAFDNATMGSVTKVRYNETDADGWVRFVGGSTLGVSAITPARIEVVGDPTIFVEFTTGAVTDAGAYRSQPATVTASASWPPADGTPVIVYPATDWLREVIQINADAALPKIGRTGAAAVFDEIHIWPTEADVAYLDSYFGRDHGLLRAYLDGWADAGTMWIYTLPWPYSATAPAQVKRWWYAIEELVNGLTGNTILIDLSVTRITDWEAGVNDYIHVDTGEDMVRVGRLIYRAGAKGGLKLPRTTTAEIPWVPTVTGILNFDLPTDAVWQGGWYQRIGGRVHFGGKIQVDPTLGALTPTQVAIDLPIASDLKLIQEAIGVGVSSVTNYGTKVEADPANDRLLVVFLSESTGIYTINFTGSYLLY